MRSDGNGLARTLYMVGAPSSAGAYAPGQEDAPQAIRATGFLDRLTQRGVAAIDLGDVPAFRWKVDPGNPRAMNAGAVERVARDVAERVAQGIADGGVVLVLGGDCTIELGSVSGASSTEGEVGLVYVDLDTDLNTPATVDDGALDWMGLAHLLGLPGTVPALAKLGPREPLLRPDQIHLFANDNSTEFERSVIIGQKITQTPLAAVVADAGSAARTVARGWASSFAKLVVHLDVDVLDFLDMPLAENTRRNRGLRFDQLVRVLREFVAAPNWSMLTVCEVNPSHGEEGGGTVRMFAEALVDLLAESPRLRRLA